MLVKYVGSAVMTLYHGGQAVIALFASRASGSTRGPVVTSRRACRGRGRAWLCLVRGVRFAALAILAVETGSLLFIVGLMLLPAAGTVPAAAEPVTAPHGVLY